MTQLYIRPANIDNDLSALIELTRQLGYSIEPTLFRQRLNAIHLDAKYTTLVAEYNQKIIAYSGLIEQFTWQTDAQVLIIQAFVIDQNFRAQGFGKLFLDRIEAFALEKNITTLFLNSGIRPDRDNAHQFYQHLGFQKYSYGFKKSLDASLND